MTVSESLTRDEKVPLWRQIARQIEQDIRSQVLRPGDKLPTEWELTRRFGVNRHTVRRALAALAESGAVRAEQGRGTFVQEGLLDYPITRKTRFSATIRSQSREPEGKLLHVTEEKASGRIAAALELEPGAMVISFQVLRRADGHPISFGTHIFEHARFPTIAAAFRETQSVTDALQASGVTDFSRQRTSVSARLPSPEEMRVLQVAKSRPLLVTESVDVDGEGRPVAISIARFPADRVQLIFEP